MRLLPFSIPALLLAFFAAKTHAQDLASIEAHRSIFVLVHDLGPEVHSPPRGCIEITRNDHASDGPRLRIDGPAGGGTMRVEQTADALRLYAPDGIRKINGRDDHYQFVDTSDSPEGMQERFIITGVGPHELTTDHGPIFFDREICEQRRVARASPNVRLRQDDEPLALGIRRADSRAVLRSTGARAAQRTIVLSIR